MLIQVKLDADRTKVGRVSFLTAAQRSKPGALVELSVGGFPCLGKSDNAAAAAHGNPSRNPLLPFGDLPEGRYDGVVTVPGKPSSTYGPGKRILLRPVDGQALAARGRWGLMIHGGALNARGLLRPTHGCLRVHNETMAALIEACEAIPAHEPIEVYVYVSRPGPVS